MIPPFKLAAVTYNEARGYKNNRRKSHFCKLAYSSAVGSMSGEGTR